MAAFDHSVFGGVENHAERESGDSGKVLGALTAFPLEPGKNAIDMKYTPGGFKTGAIISLLSLFYFVLRGVKRPNRDKGIHS